MLSILRLQRQLQFSAADVSALRLCLLSFLLLLLLLVLVLLDLSLLRQLLALLLIEQNVFDLAIWCFSGFAALTPLVIAALYWRRATKEGRGSRARRASTCTGTSRTMSGAWMTRSTWICTRTPTSREKRINNSLRAGRQQ